LEEQEERGYARLQLALERDDPIAIDAAQTYWLKVGEVLRRLDRELEISRRREMIPLRTAQGAVTFVSEWLRISLSTLLSAEGLTLAGGFKTFWRSESLFHRAIHRRHVFDAEKRRPDKFVGSALGFGANQNRFQRARRSGGYGSERCFKTHFLF
jgi:hypothetical protein